VYQGQLVPHGLRVLLSFRSITSSQTEGIKYCQRQMISYREKPKMYKYFGNY